MNVTHFTVRLLRPDAFYTMIAQDSYKSYINDVKQVSGQCCTVETTS